MILTRALQFLTRMGDRGVMWSIRFLAFRTLGRTILRLTQSWTLSRVREILACSMPGTQTYVIHSTLDYAFPYDQRPHHLARAFARKGHRVFFISRLSGYDQVATIAEAAPGLYVTPHRNVIADLIPNAVSIVFSTDMHIDERHLWSCAATGTLVYDYLDALDDSISSGPVTPERRRLHDRLVAAEDEVICVASADVLLAEVACARSRNYGLVENAVDTSHFRVARDLSQLTPAQRRVVDAGRPIAGYFGALASWFDYELLLEAARRVPEVSFVAIGLDYDGSTSALSEATANLYVLPATPYAQLPHFAVWFDVALLPFKVNEITMATSPLKLFEYMSLGLPIVATPIPEARKYKSVLLAADAPTFASQVRAGIAARWRPGTVDAIRAEALLNDWSARAETIARLVAHRGTTPVDATANGPALRKVAARSAA